MTQVSHIKAKTLLVVPIQPMIDYTLDSSAVLDDDQLFDFEREAFAPPPFQDATIQKHRKAASLEESRIVHRKTSISNPSSSPSMSSISSVDTSDADSQTSFSPPSSPATPPRRQRAGTHPNRCISFI